MGRCPQLGLPEFVYADAVLWNVGEVKWLVPEIYNIDTLYFVMNMFS